MNLYQYQSAALTTAQPRAFEDAYLIPMIVGEAGELFGQKAKSHWHGWAPERLRTELISEFGDICWGTAILLHTRGVHHMPETDVDRMFEFAVTRWGNRLDPWHLLLQRVHALHTWSTELETQQYIQGEAQQLWTTLSQICLTVTGADFETVLRTNLDKLASRAARGTLIGSGDHR